MTISEQYKETLRNSCLRWLHGIDLRESSTSYGVCDRDYWAWKVKDFSNGTMQAAISGFLDSSSLLNYSDDYISKIVEAVLIGTKTIQRSNGSFEEAYPYESSYAVTGLVLYNLMYSYLRYSRYFSESGIACFEVVTFKAYAFLSRNKEKHGVISNHLCSSILAKRMYEKYNNLGTNDYELSNFIKLQHNEGWFPEYGLADPGYQSLLNHYLRNYYLIYPDEALTAPLEQSLCFVNNFLYPNGGFAGEIGARGTRILYPSGVAQAFEEVEKHISREDCVSPLFVDSGNFTPVFNSWSSYFANFVTFKHVGSVKDVELFEKAGLIVYRKQKYFLSLNLKKGTFLSERFSNGEWEDLSIVNVSKGSLNSQLGKVENLRVTDNQISFDLMGASENQMLNSATKSIVIRVLGIIFYYSTYLQNIWKWLLAKIVMQSGSECRALGVSVAINLSEDIDIEFSDKSGEAKIYRRGFWMHMASANTYVGRNHDSSF